MLDTLKEYALLPASSKTSIALFLLEHLDTIEQFSLDELAHATYTSKASLVRFAQSLGYKGWTDFFRALLAERYYSDTHYSSIDHNLPFAPEDDSSAIIQHIATIQKESIQDTADRLLPHDVETAVHLLQTKSRIVLFGLSPNEYLAQLFRRKMLTLGRSIEVARAGEFGLMAASLTSEDVAILISYSGLTESTETLKVLPILQEGQVPIIGLTGAKGSSLRQAAQVTLTICSREDLVHKIGNFSTEESILFLLNTLYAVYFKADYAAHYQQKLSLSKQLEKGR